MVSVMLQRSHRRHRPLTRRAASGLPQRRSPIADDAVDGGLCTAYIWIIGLCWVYYQRSLHPVQVLKSHLQLICGSMILDHIRTQF